MISRAVVPIPQHVDNQIKSNFASWGAAVAEGTPTLGRDGGELLIIMMYAHNISAITEIEFGLANLSVLRLFGRNNRVVRDTLPYLSLSWIGDVSIMIQPFSGTFQRLRLGVGPTITAHNIMLKINSAGSIASGIIDSNGVQLTPQAPVPASYSEARVIRGIGLGVNIKMDYLVPIAPNVDICFRGQIHLFRSTDMRQNALSGSFTDGGLGSIGAFVRVGW